jgi:hypothetical protein
VSRLADLGRVYAGVARRGALLFARHWWLGLVFAAYEIALIMATVVAAPFGLVGGFLIAIAFSALASSGLVLLGSVVRQGRATFADLPTSFGVYLGDVLTFRFLLWVLAFVAGQAFPPGSDPATVFWLVVFVLLSSVPEQIYLAGESGLGVFVGSYKLVAEHWLEWLPAAGLLYVGWELARDPSLGLLGALLGGLALAFMLICRGLLFLEITTSSRRAREFRRRAVG